jgi:hypothetical protein
MTTKLTRAGIHELLDPASEEHKQSLSAFWSDHRVIEMEIRGVDKRLNGGYSSAQLTRIRGVSLRGSDCVPEMVEQAKLRTADQRGSLLGSLEFAVGDDITNLKEPAGAYGTQERFVKL